MTGNRTRRKRGVVLTNAGEQKLRMAIAQFEAEENFGQKLTLEELGDRTGLDPGTVAKVLDGEQGVDRRTCDRFFRAFNLELLPEDTCKPEARQPSRSGNQDILAATPLPPDSPNAQTCIDWGEAVDTSIFYGRTQELHTLSQWILQDQCRLVALLGMGGIGKTALSIRLSETLQGNFDYLIWRSLREAPPLEKILADLIQVLSDQQEIHLPDTVGDAITRLIYYLHKSRCLVVLDNVESILQGGTQAGHYREGYADYGRLIQRIGESRHQSCLVLTSREKPRELTRMEGPKRLVRSLLLQGLEDNAGQEFLKAEGLQDNDAQWQQVFTYYGGNPLALKIAANTIQDLFGGDIAEFLKQGVGVFGDIRDLLEQQFDRLAAMGQSVMYWLAINREPISMEELREDILEPMSTQQLLETLEALKRRSLIERSDDGFTLQNVVMEYLTEQFTAQILEEIQTQTLSLFNSHALLKATAKDYLREIQIRLIVQPLTEQLAPSSRELMTLAPLIHQHQENLTGYAAGNLLNLLCNVLSEVEALDLSHLTIRQAYLKGKTLYGVNFSHAQFRDLVLTHTFGVVLAVTFSPDGNLLATGNGKGNIFLWNVENREYVATLSGHIDWVRTVVFTPDGKTLISGGDDKTIRIWDIETQQCTRILEGHEEDVLALAITSDGKVLASSGADQTIRIWDLARYDCLKILRSHENWIWSLAFSANNTYLASGSNDQSIRIWDINTYQCLNILTGHTGGIESLSFSPDHQWLASSSRDRTIRLWDLQTFKTTHILTGHTRDVRSVAFHASSKILASSGYDRTIRLWDIDNQSCIYVFKEHTDVVPSISFRGKDTLLASGSFDQTIRLWDIQDQQCIHVFRSHPDGLFKVRLSTSGEFLATTSEDHHTRLWNFRTHKHLQSLAEQGSAIAFSPDETSLASNTLDGSIQLWSIRTGQCSFLVKKHRAWITDLAFSPNGERLVSVSEDGTVQLHDLQTLTSEVLLQTQRHIYGVAFSSDQTYLAAAGSDRIIWLWNLQALDSPALLQGHTSWLKDVTFSPDSTLIASCGDDQTIRVWDVSSHECVQILTGHHSNVSSVAFSPDGNWLASSSYDQTVRLWSVQTGQCCHVFHHQGRVHSVIFSPDSATLISGSEDGTIRFWDIVTNACITILRALRPYEGTNITGVTGLTEAQKSAFLALGAVEAVE
jgi:WD40 repeat protein